MTSQCLNCSALLDRLMLGGSKEGVGVHSGLSAILATKYNFDFVWISSFELSAAYGLPDAGLVSSDELLCATRAIRRVSQLPIVVDMESGHGDPVKVYHLVKALILAGATAFSIEDNPYRKRSSLFENCTRQLVTIEEHVARLRAAKLAIDELRCQNILIARTEALVAGLGIEEALKRAHSYIGAGFADAVFFQSVDRDGTDVKNVLTQWKEKTPVFLAPTKYSHVPHVELYKAGASHIISANQGIRAIHRVLDRVYSKLKHATCSKIVEDEISSVGEICSQVGVGCIQEMESMLYKVLL